MKKGVIFLVCLLLFNVVSAVECDDRYVVSAVFFNVTDKCEDLSYIKVEDTGCKPFPPPGTCWDKYGEAELFLPEGLDTQSELEKELRTDNKGIPWSPVNCLKPGTYKISVRLKDKFSDCDIYLNVTTTATKSDVISSNLPLIIFFLFIALIILSVSLFFIFKKK